MLYSDVIPHPYLTTTSKILSHYNNMFSVYNHKKKKKTCLACKKGKIQDDKY